MAKTKGFIILLTDKKPQIPDQYSYARLPLNNLDFGVYRALLDKADAVLYEPSLSVDLALALLLATLASVPTINIQAKNLIRRLKDIKSKKIPGFSYKSITIRDIQVPYITAGSPKNPKLFFFHGLGARAATYLLLLKTLKKYFYVIAPDLPYFGQALIPDPSRPWTIDEFGNFVSEFVKKLSRESVILSGHSLGGAIAANAAIKLKSRVKKLILFNPAGEKITTDMKELMFKFWILKTIHDKTLYSQSAKLLPKAAADFAASLLKNLKRKTNIGFLTESIVSGDKTFLKSTIEIPTILFYSDKEELFDRDYILRYMTHFTCLRLVFVRGGHDWLVFDKLDKPEILIQ